jgi:polyketide synthase PksN
MALAQQPIPLSSAIPLQTPVLNTVGAIEDTREILREKSKAYFKRLISETLKIPPAKVDTDLPLEKYGIDSIMIIQLTDALRKDFTDISSTIFFEYRTIDALVDYFLETRKDALIKLTGWSEPQRENPSAPRQATLPRVEAPLLAARRSVRSLAPKRDVVQKESVPRSSYRQDIAIVGLAGRYPQANTLQEFWTNLKEGRDCISEIPRERWDWQTYFDHEKGKLGSTYSKWGGFLTDIDCFDPLFFQISPKEAEQMDPQERLFLEIAYASIEDAGYTPTTLVPDGKVGVFVGVMNSNYASGTRHWSIANRLSYLLNFQGPSLAVDTACSSSLTAIHLALESLSSGTCDCAIVGGVNLIVDPIHYIKLSAATMLSEGDQCRPFGDQADGFVDGEAVGAMVIKPLSRAIADGDHIYGLLKGSMLNAGGKTNGYTVPNPQAQTQLISEALQRAAIHPRAISYIEAHGTGTALGDPIEISALTRAFQQHTPERQYCSLGSVKSNIGHCESAAGIAGITKILLQMKHGQLVPSLHSKVLNPNIDFASTPFVVQQELADWKRPQIELDGERREYPRLAGISSFGAGGANVHIIIQEYIPSEMMPLPITQPSPVAIVLSAKNEERLKEQAQRLLAVVVEPNRTVNNLSAISYTLQVGREAMEERVAFTVGSMKELEEKLRAFLNDQDGIEGFYRGKTKEHKEMLSLFARDDELAEAVEKWVERRKYSKLLDLWVKGLYFDWNKLYKGLKPQRISLPTYPFAREHYWMAKNASVNIAVTRDGVAPVHALVQRNTSNFAEQRFSSVFTGQEFFLRDHIVRGQPVMPGVAYLEMAHVAVREAIGNIAENITREDPISLQLKNVAWLYPLTIEAQPVEVHIALSLEEQSEITYEIYREVQQAKNKRVVYCQGSATLQVMKERPVLDLVALTGQCNLSIYSSEHCYKHFRAAGLEYGDGYRAIQALHVGHDQMLARLSLPETVADTLNQFTLHPILMDAALQAMMGFRINDLTSSPPSLPFALQELNIYGTCSPTMWAWVRYSDESQPGERVQKFDIDLCHDQGQVSVKMRGISCRPLAHETSETRDQDFPGTLMLHRAWREAVVEAEESEPVYVERRVILCEMEQIALTDIEAQMRDVYCTRLSSEYRNMGERFQTYALQIFNDIQRLLKGKPEGNVLFQIVVSAQAEQLIYAGLVGLLKTAHLENPQFLGQIIEVEPGQEDALSLVAKLEENGYFPYEDRIRYQGEQRYIANWSELSAFPGAQALPWKDQGIYLITGGMGGLGLLFAREIARQTEKGTLILVGRSPLNEEKVAHCKEIEALGGRAVYRQGDVADERAVGDLVQSVCQEFGRIDGIIHSAGITRDSFIIQKSQEQFLEVLAPKIKGLINLDQATRALNLDFLICFSSIASELGNVGQADYALANAFLDAYVRYRNTLVAQQQRRGQTLSINWPLWQSGGLRVDDETEEIIRQSMGMVAMSDKSGIRAFYQAVASDQDQVVVLEGDRIRMRKFLLQYPQMASDFTLGQPPGKGETKELISYEDCLELSQRIAEGDVTEEQLMEILIAATRGESQYES